MAPSLRDFVTPTHVKDLVASTWSSYYNPRNLESDGYTCFMDSMAKLVKKIFTRAGGTLAVRQQHNLWLTKEAVNPLKLPKDEGEAAFPDGYSDTEEVHAGEPRRSIRLKSQKAAVDSDLAAKVKRRLEEYNKTFQRGVASGSGHGADHEIVDQEDDAQAADPYDGTNTNHQGDDGPGEASSSRHVVGQADIGHAAEEHPGNQQTAEHDSEDPDLGEDIAGDFGNVSMETRATVPNSKGQDNFPDATISHTCVMQMEDPGDPDARFAWDARLHRKVIHQCFLAVVELKRNPSRCLRDEALERERQRLLELAEAELLYYIATQLHRDKQASAIIAISGAGMWWRWAQFSRAEAVPLRFWTEAPILTRKEENDYKYQVTQMVKKFHSAPINYIGTEKSDAEWTKLRKDALIPILEAHTVDYPTSVPPPRPVRQFTVGKATSLPAKNTARSSGSKPLSTQRRSRR
ncbi:hypothetical protein C8T65DRAFT_637113 [Cerioporus squamosus]|nr:hypothetical protein C8T65DRAFT_637113 [Cerioporus squamosus]